MEISRGTLRSHFLLLSLLSRSQRLRHCQRSNRYPKPTDVPATVIAHLPLPQATGNQMLLQKENGEAVPLRSAGGRSKASWWWT